MRLRILLASALLTATAFAQTHGTPASVGSPQSNGQFMVPTGVPASVTSLGPQGFTPGINPLFPSVHSPRGHRGGGRHHGGVIGVPVYYGYYPYYGYDYSYDQQQVPPQQQPEAAQQQAPPQQLQIVVVDKREEEKRAKANEEAVQASAEPKKTNLSDPPEQPATFVFKDGTRKELANFAVMAGNLYDLSEGKMVKIPLNTLDRDATIAANEKAGREISLP